VLIEGGSGGTGSDFCLHFPVGATGRDGLALICPMMKDEFGGQGWLASGGKILPTFGSSEIVSGEVERNV
jgi:hypothetical protein